MSTSPDLHTTNTTPPILIIKQMKKKKTLAIILASVVLISGIFLLLLLTGKIKISSDKPVEPVIVEPDKPEEKVETDDKVDYQELWNKNKTINSDYIGNIVFESRLIDLPVVQGASNDTYLRTDWETMNYDEEGSIFLDYRNYLDDQNLIIYGHYVYESYEPSKTHKFTPLDKLKEKENYEENKIISLTMENDIRVYEIAVVYYCRLIEEDGYYITDPSMEYYHTNYDADYFNTYKSTIYQNAFYDTGVDITMEDRLLTLQTCVENRGDLRLIVVCKEIAREPYKK